MNSFVSKKNQELSTGDKCQSINFRKSCKTLSIADKIDRNGRQFSLAGFCTLTEP